MIGAVVSWVLMAGAAVGCLYLAAAALLAKVPASFERPQGPHPSVTIVKPLHGAETGLFDSLATFCVQRYPAPVEIVFGVQDAADPAIAVVELLKATFPDRTLLLVVDARRHGSNAKVSNLANMAELIRHDVVVLADSDIRVGPDYLGRLVTALAQPGVGGVTCLYHGLAMGGLWSRLSALAIDTHFLPGVIVGVAAGLARPCMGSTIALRKAALDEIGGLAVFADRLADDYAIGEALRAKRHAVAVPGFLVGHVCAETTLGELWAHELRWSRTIRSIDPAGHAGSLLMHPFPLALLAFALGGGGAAAALALLALLGRLVLCARVERAHGLARHPYWLIPLRDLLSFAVFASSFLGRGVSWKGHRWRVVADGTLVSGRRPPPS